jgi:hypothetical protein
MTVHVWLTKQEQGKKGKKRGKGGTQRKKKW